jgi:hypothetical protein
MPSWALGNPWIRLVDDLSLRWPMLLSSSARLLNPSREAAMTYEEKIACLEDDLKARGLDPRLV